MQEIAKKAATGYHGSEQFANLRKTSEKLCHQVQKSRTLKPYTQANEKVALVLTIIKILFGFRILKTFEFQRMREHELVHSGQRDDSDKKLKGNERYKSN